MRTSFAVLGTALTTLTFLAVSCTGSDEAEEIAEDPTDDGAPFGEVENVGYETAVPVGQWRSISGSGDYGFQDQATAWTDDQALFWSGNLGGGLTNPHLGGRLYAPATDEWTEIVGHNWGGARPSAVAIDGVFYLAADGLFRSYEPDTNSWADLSTPEGLIVAGIAEVGGTIYGFGPETEPTSTEYSLRASVYDVAKDSWQDGDAIDGYRVGQDLVDNGVGLEHRPIVDGSSIVLWQTHGLGLGYDTTGGAWRRLPMPVSSDGAIFDSKVVATDAGLVAAVSIDFDAEDVLPGVRLAILRDGEWHWLDPTFEGAASRHVGLVSAGDWVLAFEDASLGMVAVHVPTGRWIDQPGMPVSWTQSTVWTGEAVIFNGLPIVSMTLAGTPSRSATWTPPEGVPDPHQPADCPAADRAATLRQQLGLGGNDQQTLQAVANGSSHMVRGALTWSSELDNGPAIEFMPFLVET